MAVPKMNGQAAIDVPFNRECYRYTLVEDDMHAPNRQQWHEAITTEGKPIPSYMYRVVISPTVTLSAHDRG